VISIGESLMDNRWPGNALSEDAIKDTAVELNLRILNITTFDFSMLNSSLNLIHQSEHTFKAAWRICRHLINQPAGLLALVSLQGIKSQLGAIAVSSAKRKPIDIGTEILSAVARELI
jgi:hypothetical protein